MSRRGTWGEPRLYNPADEPIIVDTYASTQIELDTTTAHVEYERQQRSAALRTITNIPSDIAMWISEHDPLPVVAWDDTTDALGFDPRSPYVETYWLAVLGPSSVLAARRLADWLEDHPSGIEINLEDLGHSLGLGRGTGRHAPIVRTLCRLVMFDTATIAWDSYALRRTMPPLARSHQRRLPAYLAERHDDDLRRMTAQSAVATVVLPRGRIGS